MFNQKMKNEYLRKEKIYTKKGKQGSEIGKIVKIDWDLNFGELPYVEEDNITKLEDAESEIQNWIKNNEEFIITDSQKWGLSSTVTLDHRFNVSGYRVYDVERNEYIFKFENINGDGIKRT
jgi:hypothetical protein